MELQRNNIIKNCILLSIICVLIEYCGAPPVTKEKNEEKDVDGLEDYMEYHRYLREVVTALESDPEFRKKLEQAKEEDIRSGKIAHELEYVSHHVRTRLDEIKRTELARLRDLVEKKKEILENNVDHPSHHHVDHKNPHTFEIEDLKKLIAKTTQDLAEADRKRRDDFKEYEMQKEMEKQIKLNHTNGDERQKLEKEYQEMEKKHKEHEKLHEPGHKQQLEEVWEEQDHMQQDFDPKTFFMLHDLDGNGLWDQDEVKALFIKELDKMYSSNAPEDDMRERMEEMERMRETVFSEVDTNKDGFIDFQEFLEQTKRNDFQQDHGWKGLDEDRPYTDEEFAEYLRAHQISNEIPQYPPGHMPPPNAAYQQMPSHLPQGQVPPNNQQQQFHPGQLPQAQINPHNLPHAQVPPQVNPNIPNYQNQLNTNEIYQGNQVNQQQQQHPAQQNYQQQPNVQQNYQQQPNVQHHQAQNVQQQNAGQPNIQHQQQNVGQQNFQQQQQNFQQQQVPQQQVKDQNLNQQHGNNNVPQVQQL